MGKVKIEMSEKKAKDILEYIDALELKYDDDEDIGNVFEVLYDKIKEALK